MIKPKICKSEEEYIGLMKTLEKYGFRWACGQLPTDKTVLSQIEYYPVKICFGAWGDGSKRITYSHRFD